MILVVVVMIIFVFSNNEGAKRKIKKIKVVKKKGASRCGAS